MDSQIKVGQNNTKRRSLSVSTNDNTIIVNGIEYEIPSKVKTSGHNQEIINGKIYLNGWLFDYETGTWSKSLWRRSKKFLKPLIWLVIIGTAIYAVIWLGNHIQIVP